MWWRYGEQSRENYQPDDGMFPDCVMLEPPTPSCVHIRVRYRQDVDDCQKDVLQHYGLQDALVLSFPHCPLNRVLRDFQKNQQNLYSILSPNQLWFWQ